MTRPGSCRVQPGRHRQLLLLAVAALQSRAADGVSYIASLHEPPGSPAEHRAWLEELGRRRAKTVKNISYTGAIYEDNAVNWTRLSYVQPQTHLFDRYLYDPVQRRYTVDLYLKDVQDRYGGIDSILLWPTYTNIGIDARNQFDYFRALPGGLEGLRQLTSEFKSRGVRVLWAYNPWDQATRDEGEPHWKTLAKLLRDTGGDGFNGDTMNVMYRQFWEAGVETGYRIVGEMEDGGYPVEGGRPEDASWESAGWTTAGWGYFNNGTEEDLVTYRYDVAPGIDKLKWLDSRRMTHVCDRWAKNRTSALQYAFFNGVGFESWENVWGVFMHFTPRDGEATRRVATLLRWLGRWHFVQDYAEWEPYTPDLARDPGSPFALGGPIASKFVHRSGDCLWLIVNRGPAEVVAAIDTSKCAGADRSLYDLYHGVPMQPHHSVQVLVEPHGFGALLATARDLDVQPLLDTMRNLTRVPLMSLSADWAPLPQQMVNASAAPKSGGGGLRWESVPVGAVLVPRTAFRFRTAGVMIEGGCDRSRDTWGVCCSKKPSCPKDEACKDPCANQGDDSRGVDVQFPWESTPNRFHDRLIEVGPFFIDRHLVTKGNYSRYLHDSGYRPLDGHNFLQGWDASTAGGLPRPRAGEENQPVVWVSLAEARAYCNWAGKRLPHAYEWQLAAQGTDGRRYPWGNASDHADGRHFPPLSNGSAVPPLPDVGAFSPGSDSPFGVTDMVGFVWQYTDEFQDEHTRTVLVKGSSSYTPMVSAAFPARPQSANWYFPRALEVDRHNRMMLMDDSFERAGTLGFRCVADHAEGQAAPHHYQDLEGPTASVYV